MYNRSKLYPILLVLLVLKLLRHLLVFERCCVLDQDAPKVFTPVCLTFRECVDGPNKRFDLLDCACCDTVYVQVLITQVGLWPTRAKVDVLIIIVVSTV